MVFLSPEPERKPRAVDSGLVQPEKSLGACTYIFNIRSIYKIIPMHFMYVNKIYPKHMCKITR